MVKSADAFRTISEVADWLGVPAHVLRFWESKFTQIKPVKRAGGRRYYRPTDMQLLGGIRKLLHDDGMTIKGVQKIIREQGVRNVASLSPPFEGDEDLYESGIALDVEQDPEPHRGRVLHFGRETGEAATSLDTSDEAAPEAPDRPEEEDGATDLYAGDDSGPKEPWRAPPSLAADEDMTDPRKDPDAAAEYRPGPADEDPRSEDGPAIAPRPAATAPPFWAPAAPADDHPGHNATRGDPAARPDPAAPPPAEPNREKIWFPSDADGDSDKAAGEAAPAAEPPVAGPGAYAARTEDDGPPQSDVAAGIATEEPARQAAISPLQAEDDTVSETAPASLRVTPISLPDDPPDTLPADPGALARLAGLPRPVNQETAAELAALAERLRARRPSRASTPR